MANSILSHRLVNAAANNTNNSNGASTSGRNGGAGEKRSRNGCQMCKSRRKKCPEDFNVRSNGKLSCSTCFQKGLDCHPPNQQEEESILQRSTPKRILTARTQNRIPSPGTLSTQPSINFNTFQTDSTSGPNLTNPFNSSSFQSQPPTILQSFPQSQLSQQPAIPSSSATGLHTTNDLQDAAWLNDFFKEFSNLSDPIYQDAIWLANNQPNVSNAEMPSQNASMPSPSAWTTNTPAASAPSTTTKRLEVPSGRAEYDRIVQSDELDDLLERYKPLYEKVWRATISVSEKDDGLMRGIFTLSRASKACRAASVSACLSLHRLMQRERKLDRPSCGMGLIHQLLEDDVKGSPAEMITTPANLEDKKGVKQIEGQEPTAEDHMGMAYKWYQFAADEYERSGSNDTMAERLATLLNLRYTIIALDGARAGLTYMEEIRKLLLELGVSTHYMRYTSYCGTIMGVMVQSTLLIDIFEAATKRHKRCAVRASPTTNSLSSTPAYGGTPSSSIATDSVTLSTLNSEMLAQDLQKGPLYEYEFLSCLSCDIIECLLHICNLDADIHEGLLSPIVKKGRIEEVECMIRQARLVRKNNNDGAAFVRSIAVHEMWRQAALIQFYQRILNLGALASKVQRALQEILSLADMLSTTLSPSETWDMWMVWFLASTVAITPEQRKKCILYLEALGSEQAIMDNLVIIKQLWKASDETGYPQDWYSIAEANGLSVCYAF